MAEINIWQDREYMPEDHEFEAYHKRDEHWKSARFHAHEFYEFFMFLGGSASIQMENHTYDLSPGDFLIFPPGSMHRIMIRNAEVPYERLYFYTTESCFRSMSDGHFRMDAILEDIIARHQFSFRMTEETIDRLRSIVDEIIDRIRQGSAIAYPYCRCLIQMALLTVFDEISGRQAAVSGYETDVINEVLAYVQEHYCEDIDQDRLAERFGISKYYMLHRFRQLTSTSLHQYMLTKRVLLSCRMLLNGVHATEVAIRCGFADYSCFYRAFRGKVGMSPQAYIDRHIRGDAVAFDTDLLRIYGDHVSEGPELRD